MRRQTPTRFMTLLTLACLALHPLAAEERTWTDNTGKFSVEAEFVDIDDGNVRLKRSNTGKVISVPLKRLSDVPQNATFFVSLVSGLKEVTVPFSVSNLSMP